ncbi:MAG TPA: DUF308 domain-containing protein [Thermomicrobiales bacterium]|nr:DUF308 domain-containing protein [Thermomicrobiales bacterium]
MDERAKALALRSVPWREGVGWPIVAIEGIALLAVGLFMVFRPDDAGDVTRTLLGAALLVVSLQYIVNAFRNPGHPFLPFQMLRGGIGATVGLLVAVQPLVSEAAFSAGAARIVLGVGLLVVGAIGLAGLLTARDADRVQIEAVISSALTIGFGFVLLAGNGGRAPLIGWVIAVAGLGLLAYAAVLLLGRRRARAATGR